MVVISFLAVGHQEQSDAGSALGASGISRIALIDALHWGWLSARMDSGEQSD